MSESTSAEPIPRARADPWLGWSLLALAAGLAVNSLLGPLAVGVIRYRFSSTLIYQGIGLDVVSLVLVAPLCVVAGLRALRGRPMARVLSLGPGAYCAYMSVQYAIGPEYLALPGNNERFFLLHLGLFVLGGIVCARAWSTIDPSELPPASRRGQRGFGVLLSTLGLLLLLRYLPPLAELAEGAPGFPEFVANPTSFLLITWLDLGVFASAAILAGIALAHGHAAAKKILHTFIGWLALSSVAVAAMSVVMWWKGDPMASPALTAILGTLALASVALAWWLYRLALRHVEAGGASGQRRTRGERMSHPAAAPRR